MFRDLQKAHTVFTDIAAHRLFGANLSFRNQTLNGEGVMVSGATFPVLGVRPVIGRLLSPQDDQKVGESLVVVLSHAYWTTRFDRDPKVLNETLIVNGQHLTIVGVAPEGFDGTTLGARPQVYVPITLRGLMNPGFNQFHNRRTYWAYLFARLRPGATIDQARTAAQSPLSRDHQRRGSAAAEGHERSDVGALQGEAGADGGRRARPELGATGRRARRSSSCSASPASC